MSPMSHKPKYFVPPEDASGQRFCRKCGAKLRHNARTYFCEACTPQDAPWKQLDKGESQAPARQQSQKPSYTGPQYMCPRCHTPVDTPYGRCPRGDFSGKMLPIEAPQPIGSSTPEEAGIAPTPASLPWPAVPQSMTTQQSRGVPDTRLRYACPRCGTEVDPASNECPNRGCGYIGAMQRVEMEQQPTTTAPATASATPTSVYPPSPPTQLSDEPSPGAAGEGTITPSRSPLLNEITAAEPKEPDVIPPPSPLLTEITRDERREWAIPQWARQTLANVASAARAAARPSWPAPTGWSIPPSTRRLLLRGFWAAVFLAIAGLGSYYAVTKTGNVALPSSSTANPITIPIPPPAPTQTYTLATNVNPEAAGQVSPSPENETYTSDSEVTLTATPASGYTFNQWGGDVSGSSAEIPVISITMDSNKSLTAYFKPTDTTPPEISAVGFSPPTDISAIMTWQTDEDATSQVEYWRTESDHETTPLEDALKQSHTVRLASLKPNTTYHFTVKSVDDSGNVATSSTKTLTTLRAIPLGYEVGNRAPLIPPLPEYNDVSSPESPNDGETVDLTKFLGKKKVLLNFWSTHCGACVVEVPFIREVYHGDACRQNDDSACLAVITVCIDGDRIDRIEKIIERHNDKYGPFDFPILLDAEDATTDIYHLWTAPTTFFTDSDGIIREIKIGRFHDTEEIEGILDRIQ